MRALLLTVLALGLTSGAVGAQGPPGGGGGGRPLSARGLQDLSFGDLIPGVSTTVLPTDPVSAARIEIRGQGRSDVLVDFLLPPELSGGGGAAVPLDFPAGSGGYSRDESVEGQTSFDPNSAPVVTLPSNGRGTVFLGGTAAPPAATPAGTYSATLTLTLSYVGN